MRGLTARLGDRRRFIPEQTLLLLVLASMTTDYVLNSIREAGAMRLDASYGPVILWDTATFFCWLRAVDLCDRKEAKAFGTSWVVATVPFWKLGREILWLPYDGVKPYIDVVAGDLAVASWIALWCLRHRERPSPRSIQDTLAIAVVFGCFYFAVAALEEVSYLAYRPLYPWGLKLLAAVGAPSYATNLVFIVVSAALILLILWRNPWHLAERLSLRG